MKNPEPTSFSLETPSMESQEKSEPYASGLRSEGVHASSSQCPVPKPWRLHAMDSFLEACASNSSSNATQLHRRFRSSSTWRVGGIPSAKALAACVKLPLSALPSAKMFCILLTTFPDRVKQVYGGYPSAALDWIVEVGIIAAAPNEAAAMAMHDGLRRATNPARRPAPRRCAHWRWSPPGPASGCRRRGRKRGRRWDKHRRGRADAPSAP